MRHMLTLGATALLAFAAQARTVALWPMEYDAATGTPNLRCAVSGANGFTTIDAASACAETSLGWNLPPNPDATEHPLFSTVSRYVFDNQGKTFRVDSPEIAELLDLTHDFTIEGWLRPRNVKDGSWHIILQTNGGTSYANSWSLTVRNATPTAQAANVNFQMYARGLIGDTMIGRALTEAEEIDLTNSWHHVAVAFRVNNGSGKNQFTLYYDGVEWGSASFGPASKPVLSETFQEFGGRPSGARLYAEWDYWRLSDAALAPKDFLNYGGTGTVVPETPATESKTISYWKLGVRADGSIDACDYIAGNQLAQGWLVTPSAATATEQTNAVSVVAGSTDAAFAGQPPNTTASIPGGNVGSVALRTAGQSLCVPGIGANLALDRDFTVEGYFRYRENESLRSSEANDFYLFGSVDASKNACWVLRSVKDGGKRQLGITAYDASTEKWASENFADGFIPSESRWFHAALVFSAGAAAGSGTMTLYLDGVDSGSVTLALGQPRTSSSLVLLGNKNGNVLFYGDGDCIRVSTDALTPRQFLREAEKPLAATGVIAFWPLDCPDGVRLDGRDLVGSYALSTTSFDDDKYRLTAVPNDAPTISNPDLSETFHGDKASVSGSVAFRTDAKGKRGYLMSRASEGTSVIAGRLLRGNDWTIEFYTKRSVVTPTSGSIGELVVLAAPAKDGENASCNSSTLVITYGTSGFMIHDTSCADFKCANEIPSVVCPGTKDVLPANEWTHVAIVRTHETVSDVTYLVYRFYVAGELKGTLSATGEDTGVTARVAFFGGCFNYWESDCGWNGQWSSLRFSGSALAAAEFLCAEPQVPAPGYRSATLGYWPMEYKNGVLDFGCRALWDYTASNLKAANLVGSTQRGFARVANPDETLSAPVTRNVGAVSVTAGTALTFPDLGSDLGFRRAFTVEGWLKLAETATSKDEVIFGAYGDTTECGWKVYVDHSGAKPALRLWAKSAGNWSQVAGGAFADDVSGWTGVWKHLALAYDPSSGDRGEWTLFADGASVATLANAWFPGTEDWAQNGFRFGAAETTSETGFAGLLDHWRVVGRALTADELLRGFDPGLLLIFQ